MRHRKARRRWRQARIDLFAEFPLRCLLVQGWAGWYCPACKFPAIVVSPTARGFQSITLASERRTPTCPRVPYSDPEGALSA